MWFAQPTDAELRALTALRANQDFQVVLDWFKRSNTELASKNQRQPDPMLRDWGNGAWQGIDDFLKMFEGAPTALRSRAQHETTGIHRSALAARGH